LQHNRTSTQMQADLKSKTALAKRQALKATLSEIEKQFGKTLEPSQESDKLLTVTQAPSQSLSLPPLSIAVVGLLKAGKSTLLNAMTGQEELFKSGVIRTTVKNQRVNDGYFEWVDTPGIDDTDQETATAFAGLKNADTVLFTHNLKQGELDRMEVDFLQTCRQRDGQFLAKLRFVFTHIDDLEPATVDIIQQKVSQQCRTLFHAIPPMIAVSSTRYLKGYKEDKKLLMEKSVIPLLRQELTQIYLLKQRGIALSQAQQLKRQLNEQLQRIQYTLTTLRREFPTGLQSNSKPKSKNAMPESTYSYEYPKTYTW